MADEWIRFVLKAKRIRMPNYFLRDAIILPAFDTDDAGLSDMKRNLRKLANETTVLNELQIEEYKPYYLMRRIN